MLLTWRRPGFGDAVSAQRPDDIVREVARIIVRARLTPAQARARNLDQGWIIQSRHWLVKLPGGDLDAAIALGASLASGESTDSEDSG
jgi:hypothetical protein